MENALSGIVEKPEKRTLTPIKAIRAYCLDCSCDSSYEVKLCPIKDCPLYPFREGHNPNIKREYTEEQRKQMVERMRRGL